jgi:antitoxin CptB
MQTPDHRPPAPPTLCAEDRDLEPLRQKLRFRAWRRGTSEADLLLGGFVDRHVATLSRIPLEQLERLLEVDDPLVEAWVFGRRPAPAAFDNAALAMLREHFQTHSCAGRP